MIVYFSGTGNSRYCAQFLAHALNDQAMDAFSFLREQAAAELNSQRPWVFVAPTYAWQIPRVFAQFIRTSTFKGSRDAYFVLTCGGETGNAVHGLTDLCAEKGFSFRGLLPVVMPDNYLVLFPAPKPGEAEEKITAAQPLLLEAARRIEAKEDFSMVKVGALDKFKSGPINEGMYRFFIKTRPFHTTDACVKCGKCASLCPLGNIHLEEGKPIWGDRCTHCMACLCGCPVNAIEYGKATRGKARYQCPVYKD
ncbi:EFR1 family ferrodoxin [uncultured Ruthenibacterium sp.]|uniref:EFR1 family ferrodoxin n=1 Tax=uncultured Ruthenibacterium sp. TaxID=1905347 RepID=UPI00349E4CF0